MLVPGIGQQYAISFYFISTIFTTIGYPPTRCLVLRSGMLLRAGTDLSGLSLSLSFAPYDPKDESMVKSVNVSICY